jgi:hypothetical protein
MACAVPSATVSPQGIPCTEALRLESPAKKQKWRSRNPNSTATAPSGPVATNSAAAWTPANTKTTSSSSYSSNTSATNTPASPAPIVIPEGASFKAMVALKGKSDIGGQIDKKIIGPLAEANKLAEMPDFNDATKLGAGKEMVERLSNLIAIFENKALDFSKNRADGDDILGDAYELPFLPSTDRARPVRSRRRLASSSFSSF